MSKKGIAVMFVAIVAVALQVSTAMADNYFYEYFKSVQLVIGQTNAEVNNEPTTMDQAAYVKNSRTLVPLRFVGESLGAQVSWEGNSKKATLELGDTSVSVIIGSKVAYVDGQLTTLDVPAEIKGGRTFVPLRFVSESLGAYVDYDEQTKTVSVRYANQTNWKAYTSTKTGFSYKYPADWTAATAVDDFVDIFTSPKGSILSVYNSAINPEELRNSVKKDMQESGWTLEVDEPYDSNDLKQGCKLEFTAFDTDINGYVRLIINIDPLGSESLVAEMLISEQHVDIDNIVMIGIAYS